MAESNADPADKYGALAAGAEDLGDRVAPSSEDAIDARFARLDEEADRLYGEAWGMELAPPYERGHAERQIELFRRAQSKYRQAYNLKQLVYISQLIQSIDIKIEADVLLREAENYDPGSPESCHEAVQKLSRVAWSHEMCSDIHMGFFTNLRHVVRLRRQIVTRMQELVKGQGH